MNKDDFTKEFFQRSWGEGGYYERFSYGVGIDAVIQTCLVPFFNLQHNAIEIGCGGGSFTEKMIGRFNHVTAYDVIKMPERYERYFLSEKFTYIELPDKCYNPVGVEGGIDFAFSYNCFCHLSNEALTEYFKNIHKILKPGANFVFMLANFERNPVEGNYSLGDLLPFGHFKQSLETLGIICSSFDWVVVANMIPEHRDLIIHLKKY